jgi:hypothetical protein
MSTIDKFLTKYAKGDMITAKMLQQHCRLTKEQSTRYVAYCIRIGLGKPAWDGLGLRAFTYNPNGDQRTRTIEKREDVNNQGKKRGVVRSIRNKPTYVQKKLEEFHVKPGVEVNPPPAPKPYVPPPVYASDPVLLEKFDTLIAGINVLALKLDVLIKAWSTE